MAERTGLFRIARFPVLSVGVLAEAATPERVQNQFEVLVRHLIHRFFHNELLASDDETKRVMLISYVVALPTLVVSRFLYVAYHQSLPPSLYPRAYWSQVGDHYFYVMYSFLTMGAATVYEWDLLFPDLLEVFVLSVLPITSRRLFFARVLALAIFLALVLLGTSALGIVFFPMAAELAHPVRHTLAHAAAVLMSGTFAAATFLALQGFLLNFVGERVFRRVTPVLQGGSIMLLLTVLLLYPTLIHSLQALLTSNSAAARWFPPFWFLGIYERLLDGPAAPAIFVQLSHTACSALLVMISAVVVTYPLAYRRRVRQIVEGASRVDAPSHAAVPLRRLLHALLLRIPAQRAVFHFISQTILRTQRQRVMLALYGGLAVSLALSNMLVLRIAGGHLRPALLPYGIHAAVPIVAFCVVIALSSATCAPIDRRGAWLFNVVLGRPAGGHLAAARLWISLWAAPLSMATALLLRAFSPAATRTPLVTAGEILVGVGCSILLTDVRLFNVRTIPFTHLRTSSITDFPLMVLRYFILFPLFVQVIVHLEQWMEAGWTRLIRTALLVLAAYLLLMKAHTWAGGQITLETPLGEGDEFPQRLGLRES